MIKRSVALLHEAAMQPTQTGRAGFRISWKPSKKPSEDITGMKETSPLPSSLWPFRLLAGQGTFFQPFKKSNWEIKSLASSVIQVTLCRTFDESGSARLRLRLLLRFLGIRLPITEYREDPTRFLQWQLLDEQRYQGVKEPLAHNTNAESTE